MTQAISFNRLNGSAFGQGMGYDAPVLPIYQPASPMSVKQVDVLSQPSAFERDSYTALSERRAQLPQDRLLNYGLMSKGIQHLKSIFVTLPKTMVKGLQGSRDFTFADSMLLTKFPFFVGGAVLAASYFVGKDRVAGIRTAASVVFYLLGIGLSNLYINSLYRLRYGVDLGQLYLSKNGRVEQVFASHDFPRFDLISEEQLHKIGDKMHIPKGLVDRDAAVREQLRFIISSSRALKILSAGVFAAIGAGFIGRTRKWVHVVHTLQSLRQSTWQLENVSKLQKLRSTVSSILSGAQVALIDRMWVPMVLSTLAYIGLLTGYIFGKKIPHGAYVSGDVETQDQYMAHHPVLSFSNARQPNLDLGEA